MPKIKIKLLKPVHLVDPYTNQAVRPEHAKKTVEVQDNEFWRGKAAEGYLVIVEKKKKAKGEEPPAAPPEGGEADKNPEGKD